MYPNVLPEGSVASDSLYTTCLARDALSPPTEAERALRATGYPELRHVETVFDSGTVFLRGRVISYHMKQIAQETAMRIADIRGVCNELTVASAR
jgi:hypothetical protein